MKVFFLDLFPEPVKSRVFLSFKMLVVVLFDCFKTLFVAIKFEA